MQYRVEFADDLMMLLDDDGDGYDAHVVRADGQEEALRKIDEWAADHRLDAERAKRDLRDLIRQM